MEIKNVVVVGAGQMGNGIAQLALQSGFMVTMVDITEDIIKRGVKIIEANLERQVKKGKMGEEEKVGILKRLNTTPNLSSIKDPDVVIEAVSEDEDIKKRIFAQLDEIYPQRTILASNTSSIPITKLGAATKRPEKVVGMHFMYPVPVMKLVEIVRGYLTSSDTLEEIQKLAEDMGKETIIARDFPGFTSTRLGVVLWNEAFWMVYEGQGTPEDIDKAARLGSNHPMGPLELADFVGLDTALSILKVLYEGFGNPRYFPCPLLTQMVQARHLGRKSGKGFYEYTEKRN